MVKFLVEITFLVKEIRNGKSQMGGSRNYVVSRPELYNAVPSRDGGWRKRRHIINSPPFAQNQKSLKITYNRQFRLVVPEELRIR